MASLQEIAELLDQKLEPIQATLAQQQATLAQQQATLVPIQKTLAQQQVTLAQQQVTLAQQQATLGSLVESRLRDEAKRMFGESFSKPFLIKSVGGIVHILTKAKYGGLVPSNDKKRREAQASLETCAANYVVPTVHSFYLSAKTRFSKTLLGKEVFDKAKAALDEKKYDKCLGLLIGALNKTQTAPKDVVVFMERLKKSLSLSDLQDGILSECNGPGVMLIELASRYPDPNDLMNETNVFQGLCEQIECDLRGTITMVGDHATVACGEIKSSFKCLQKAKEQLKKRLHFLKTAIEQVFPQTFSNFVLIGHVFVAKHSSNYGSQNWESQEIENDISYNVHVV
eukprot:CAMPEP_0202441356 /NCGR_PEP_ID=MMETSP1360-20130828/839_1 /ASSEMBLY_ACC=CAM_ASM_000848 /TAXON_ID=515479 /ORGANISM="Licmophora paradoxa, Strain CCMP2313" /LENGTH=341 /DNA_ID=CAMNT_0049056301 /DNA_START=111 /DNA_END=1136 /DNA_ORIENTATION=-